MNLCILVGFEVQSLNKTQVKILCFYDQEARNLQKMENSQKIDFAFKVFLRPHISRIRMFAIEILLAEVLFGAILGPAPIFQERKCQKIEIHVIHSYIGTFAYFLECTYEFGLFKVSKSK